VSNTCRSLIIHYVSRPVNPIKMHSIFFSHSPCNIGCKTISVFQMKMPTQMINNKINHLACGHAPRELRELGFRHMSV